MKTLIIILLTAFIAISATWLLKDQLGTGGAAPALTARKPHHYQCAMHPQVKSDKPGRCTICGMELTPIFEGDSGFDQTGGEAVVPLTPIQIKTLNVEIATAKVQPFTKKLKVAGTIDDDATRHRILSAYVDGRVDQLYINYMGAEVKKGQPLAEFYSPTLLQTEREYKQLTGELKNSAGLRLRQMGLTSEQISNIDQKPNEVLTTQILAPIGGTVVSKEVNEGQYVTTGDKLLEIADFSTMWFMFPAYEQDLPWLKLGQKVTITTPSKPGREFVGKITFIDPNFDETTRATQVRVELPNPIVDGRRELLHRLYAAAEVEIETPEVLAIPRPAVIETGAHAVVYVDRGNGSYAQTRIKTGRRGDALIEVLSGLSAGDKVVIQGNLLIDGQAELNHTTAPDPTAAPMDLTVSQRSAIQGFVETSDAMAAALAGDDLNKFNEAAQPAMERSAALVEALKGREGIQGLIENSHFHGIDDIKKARLAFYHFSKAATAVLTQLPPGDGVPDYQIWECPMVGEAVPGTDGKGRWIQVANRSVANPYFGSEMPTCGNQLPR